MSLSSLTELSRRFGLRLATGTSMIRVSIALGSLVLCSTGCGGCDQPALNCDSYGRCEICDAYGCRWANSLPAGGMGGFLRRPRPGPLRAPQGGLVELPPPLMLRRAASAEPAGRPSVAWPPVA